MLNVYDDIELEREIVNQRHTELLKALKLLSDAVKANNNTKDGESRKSAFVQKELMQNFLNKMQQFSKQEAPVVNVNQDEVVKSITEMQNEIIRLKEIIDAKKWVHTVTERDSSNRIKTMVSTPKH